MSIDLKLNKYWQTMENAEDLGLKSKVMDSRSSDLFGVDKFDVLSNEDYINKGASRRNFLKGMMLSTFAATNVINSSVLSRIPVEKAVPYLVAPENIIPGKGFWYASSCGACPSACSTLVKQRDGRPIKIEGNDLSKLNKGGLCAKGHASLLNLYDDFRLKSSVYNNTYIKDTKINGLVVDEIASINSKYVKNKPNEGRIYFITHTINSPSLKSLISSMIAKYPVIKHIQYDVNSLSALRKVHKDFMFVDGVPNYKFDVAKYIISINADFLGTWISPVRYTKQFMESRNINNIDKGLPMSKLVCFETRLSSTGAMADKRVVIDVAFEQIILLDLLNRLFSKIKINKFFNTRFKNLINSYILEFGKIYKNNDLYKFDEYPSSDTLSQVVEGLLSVGQSNSLLISGSNDYHTQSIVMLINYLLGNYKSSIDIINYSNERMGNDEEVVDMIEGIKSGNARGVIFYEVNPVYDMPNFPFFKLKDLDLKVSFSTSYNETSYQCDFIYGVKHFLEKWFDAEPIRGSYSIAQPTFDSNNLKGFDVVQSEDILIKWVYSGDKPEFINYYDYIVDYWVNNIIGSKLRWRETVYKGVFDKTEYINNFDSYIASKYLNFKYDSSKDFIQSGSLDIDLLNYNDSLRVFVYEKSHMGTGYNANNPWLQELPDSITKVVWDNYFAVSPKFARKYSLQQGDIVSIESNLVKLSAPVFIQPGHSKLNISIALGYGRTNVGVNGMKVGVNIIPLISVDYKKGVSFNANYTNVINVLKRNFRKTGKKHTLAVSQQYSLLYDKFTKKDRHILQHTTLKNYLNKKDDYIVNKNKSKALYNMWSERPDVKESEYSWGLSVDLNSCTGCGQCIISCQSENNIPVIGKSEILKDRTMHWIRVDRYYVGDEDNPRVLNQPMMCQHCDNAPCETVCPVIATLHDDQGLNTQIYNRCVGTRYCANNCPYKVRRFNWYNYNNNEMFKFNMSNNSLGRLQINPDVIVRTRGVMEKCSMCYQRIREAKLSRKLLRQKVQDGDIKTACSQSCPSNSITFGNLKNSNSKVSKQLAHRNSFFVLEELKTLPSVGYMTKIWND